MTQLTNQTLSSLSIQSNQLMVNSIESSTSLHESNHRNLKTILVKINYKRTAVSQIKQVNFCSRHHRRIHQKDQNKLYQPLKKKNSRNLNILPFRMVQVQMIIDSARQFISARIPLITVRIFFSLVHPSAIVMLPTTQFIPLLQLNQPNRLVFLIHIKIAASLIRTLVLIPN